MVYFAAELLVHFVSEWQSFRNRLKDRQLIIRLLKLYTKVVYFAAELLVYFAAEWWCSMVRNMHQHLEETHLPKQIAYYFRAIIQVTQAGSHRSYIDLHVNIDTIKTPFLFKSVLYQLLDVLVWFKMYLDSNPKKGNWLKSSKNNQSKRLKGSRNSRKNNQ